MRTVVTASALAVLLACSTTSPTNSGFAACVAAGGECVLGGTSCARSGPQDCNPNENPGGAFCCLDPANDAAAPWVDGSNEGSVGPDICQAPAPTQCMPAPGTSAVRGYYPVAAVPWGQPCTATENCQMAVDPCADWKEQAGGERIDGYACTCRGGMWACADCNVGLGLCGGDGGLQSDAP